MAATIRIGIIADPHGRVLAAEFPDASQAYNAEKDPSAHLLALEGQRIINVDVPREILQLPGPDLHHFFSEAKIRWPGEIELPKIKITRVHKE